MTSNEDDDLIDLGNDACVPRVTVDDPTPEEQEHLLDVCPPKLEQKLSLTKRQERVLEGSDRSDILVTLGHDQVVPICKRIDVVSSDTIKRIRDITRNLEPVIHKTCPGINEESQQDMVDHATSLNYEKKRNSTVKHEDETYEAREINNAFNFLTEHDDNEDQVGSNFGRLRNEIDSNRIVSSMCSFIEEDTVGDFFESPSRTLNDEATGNDADEKKYFTKNDYDIQLDNLAFESSPNSSTFRQGSQINEKSVYTDTEVRATTNLKRRSQEDAAFERITKRRSLRDKSHRKSWTEGTSLNSDLTDELPRIDRSTSLEEYRCVPSIPNINRGISGFFTRSTPETESATMATGTEDACSEGSEVDWSWLEEVECLRTVDMLVVADVEHGEQVGKSVSPTCGTMGRRRACDRLETGPRSVAMSVTAAAKSLAVGGSRWSAPGSALLLDRQNNSVNRYNNGHHRQCRNGNNDDENNDNDDDDDTTAYSNVTNEAVNRENRDSATTTDVVGASVAVANSWMRASMRRLRHLRLPDNTQRGVPVGNSNESANRRAAVSAPNSLPDIALIAPEILAAHTNGTSGTLLRPSSAPARNVTAAASVAATPRRAGRQFAGGRWRGSRNRDREASSRQGSLISTTTASDTIASGTTTCSSSFGAVSTGSPSSTTTSPQRAISRRICERQRDIDRHNDRGENDDEDENPLGKWPHALSPALACLGCTLGLFNISRFAILSVQFGANFIVQFLILSLILGIPLLTLHVCLGQRLAAGSVDMWRISPIFQGVGIALLAAQALIGIYSIVGVSWMFVYFRDSFITKQDKYRWAEPFLLYREDSRPTHNITTSYKLHETVPDYFSGAVLQRHHLNDIDPGVVTLKFQVAFNLAVVWMIVFVSLSKGLRSYGKVVYVFTLVPVIGTLVLCAKLLGLNATGSIQHQLFPATVWSEFFINGKSWVAASTEVFLTWGLLGAAAMQIAAHNKHKHLLQRDTSLVVVLTFAVLLLAAFLANTCVQILRHHGYIYTTSSFERISGYTFMRLANQPASPGYSTTPERFMSHTSFLLGQRVIRPNADTSIESGYQVLRLCTELVPATLALLGTEQVSPFWAILFYFIIILFGIAQQLAIWHCVITGIMAFNTKLMKLWETTITFFSCACAYILGLPMATEFGIYVVYYLDYTVGGAWWIIILYLIQVGAVFAVRGRPHTGEAVVAELFPPTGRCLRYWAGPLLSFTWNVILPVTLLVLTITIFKSSSFSRELYTYRRTGKEYWALWARQFGTAIQLIPIVAVPAVGIIQTCRYLNRGPPDIFDFGIYVVYYLDYTVGGAWWIIILYLIQVGAVFAVRGRPHTGEAVVAELFPPTGRCLRYWAGPLLSFTWNVILPVTLLVLTITIFKSSSFSRELYTYRRTGKEYWALWARQFGTAIQLIPIVAVPAVGIIQTCRYLNRGPPDIFDRIQLLYRPPLEPEDARDAHTQIGSDTGTSLHGNGILPTTTTEIPFEDPPPKYTPPPSYTTATGARIAKMLRQSFRRSVRRIANVLGESSVMPRQRSALQPPPPDYATVLVEMNQQGGSGGGGSSIPTLHDIAIHMTEPRPDVTNTGNCRRNLSSDTAIEWHRPNTIDRTTSRIAMVERRSIERTHSTLDRSRRSYANTTSMSGSNLTAADVANLLRSSIRRGTVRTQQSLRRSFCHEEPTMAVSVENLVEAAAPIGEDSLVLTKDASLVSDEQIDDRCNDNDDDNNDNKGGDDNDGGSDDDEKKTAGEMESSVSVI
ncbi:uncharacterized protein LOC116852173 isoform X2 [Odontomachus brunneus]|uniref:uncharacterized protein LOC116852173 isoform X2 n=1 Tax=Odontomachus brunneus TaxID=486640 RepID=UPI0013F233DD|nr:uncharacterized protein LOC116852173 isoform X2 [Odontomachus brunneus]